MRSPSTTQNGFLTTNDLGIAYDGQSNHVDTCTLCKDSAWETASKNIP